MKKKDYYKILDINKDADTEEIKKAFRRKALKYHPDVCKLKDANNIFIEIYEAFEILSDPIKRRAFDNSNIFKEKMTDVYTSSTNTNYETWVNDAKTKAESHSKMKYGEYKKNVMDDIIQTTRTTINIGCLAYIALMGVLGLYGFFKGLGQFNRHERDDYTFVIGLVFFIIPALPLVIALSNKYLKR
jgi:curved DNA-binding protein CbpA